MAKHPNKDIEKAIKYCVSKGWTVEDTGSSAHAWGALLCPTNNKCRGGNYCRKQIWSTPRNPVNHAKDLIRIADKCDGEEQEGGENE